MRIKEKIKEKLKQKWNDKAERYKMAGLFCLFVTVVILSLALGSNSRAEKSSVGGKEFIKLDDGTYLISNETDLANLGNLSNDTGSKIFVLEDDITVKNINLAKGIFEGTFDGNGHVITILGGDLLESTILESETAKKETTSGILFGTVTQNATVKNVIIEIEDNIAYTKTSAVGSTINGTTSSEVSGGKAEEGLAEKKPGDFITIDDTTLYEKIKNYSNGSYSSTQTTNITTTYKGKDAGNDYFGILCGKLQGTIQQVNINGADGKSLEVIQNISSSGSVTSTTSENREIKHKYEKTTTTVDFGKITTTDILVQPTILFDVKNENANEAVNSGLTLKVSTKEGNNVIENSKITYEITFENTTGKELSNVKLTSNEKVFGDAKTYEVGNISTQPISASYNITSDDIKKGNKTVTFSATATVGSQTLYTGVVSVVTTFETTTTASSASNSGSSTEGEDSLKLDVTVAEAKDVKVGTEISYQITATNATGKDLESITIASSKKDTSITGNSFSLKNNENNTNITAKYKITQDDIDTGSVTNSFSVTTGDNSVSISLFEVVVDLDTTTSFAASTANTSISDAIEAGKIKVTITTTPAKVTSNTSKVNTGYSANFEYTISIENTTGKDLKVSGFNEEWTFTTNKKWKKGDTDVGNDDGTLTSNYTYTGTGDLTEGHIKNINLGLFNVETVHTDPISSNILATSLDVYATAYDVGVKTSSEYDLALVSNILNDPKTSTIESNASKDLVISLSYQKYAVTGDSIAYTIVLKNTKEDTLVENTNEYYKYTFDVSSIQNKLPTSTTIPDTVKSLGYNETATLTVTTDKSLSIGTFEVPVKKVVPAYKYTVEIPDSKTKENTKSEGDVFAGNSLYAGVFAGMATDSAKILESVDNASISSKTTYTSQMGTVFDTKKETDETNGATLSIGFLLGTANNTPALNINDIYIKSNDATALVGTLDDSTFSSSRIVGKNNVITPNDDWTNWKKFQYYDTDVNTPTTGFALSWLVNDLSEDDFVSTLSDSTLTVDINNVIKQTPKTMSYNIVYQARKQLGDIKDQSYFVSSNKLELGKSGYYRVKSFYATDDYYHYVYMPDDLAELAWKYPYLMEGVNELNFENLNWNVQRKTGDDLEDEVILSGFTFPTNVSTKKLYYCDAGKNQWSESISVGVSEKGNTAIFTFPNTQPEFAVDLTPCIDDKLYPIVAYTGEVCLHTELPGATVMTGFYFGESTTALLKEPFQSNFVYESGTQFFIETKTTPQYTYQYAFSTVSDSSSISWENYTESVSVPNDFEKTYYFYVKVGLTNYPDTISKYGPFTVKEKAVAVPKFYYDTRSDAKQIEGSTIAVGDIYKFEIENEENTMFTTIQYKIDEDVWKDYHDGEKLVINKNSNSCTITTRLKTVDGKYSLPVDYSYFFADQSDEVKITPQTLYVGDSNIVEVPSGSKVILESYQENAKILYVFNGEHESDANTTFNIERVTTFPENLTMSDGLIHDNFTYYKVGERWYRIKINGNTDQILLYDQTKDSPIVLLNKGSTGAISRYVHTIVLTADMEASNQRSYEYKISKVGTVSKPEAVLKTKYDKDNGKEIAVAEAVKGSYLTFTSLTQGAKLYYDIGKNDAPKTEYDASKGIQVTGEVGSTFYISIQAKDASKDETTRLGDSDVIIFEYVVVKQAGIVAPSATPATSSENPSIVIPGSKILLSSNTKDATIYYTTDGSYPDVKQDEETGIYAIAAGNTSTKEYKASEGITMPLDGSGYFTIRAVNTKKGMAASEVAEFIYAYPTEVLSPYASVQDGAVAIGTQVLLKNRTEGATIYYTFAYGAATPDDPTISSSVFDGTQPFEITKNTTIKAMAMKDGIKSGIVTFKYTVMDILAAPTASLDSGSIVSRGSKLTLKAQEKALIYYTLDGSEPNAAGNAAVIQGNTLVLDGDAGAQITVKAYATLEGMTPSEVVIFTYQISQSTTGVTADIPSGTEVSNGTKVNLISDVTDAVIYYTTDGSSPLEKGKKGNVVTIAGESGGTVTIKAAAVLDGASGSVVSFTYKIKEKPGTPNASPAGGVLTIATYVELSASVDKIYYTTDGTTPTESSTLYEEPILINRTTYLQAIAVSDAGECSEVSEFQYTAAAKAEKPTATLEDGSILEPDSHISLFTDTPSAVIYYSTDGTDPTLDNLEHMIEYTEDGISIQRSVTIKAVAYRADMQLSNVSTYHYVVETIPAVEVRKAEQEKLEAEGLHDTDASELERREDYEGTAYESRILKNEDYGAVVSSTWDAIPAEAKLVVEKSEREKIAEERVKQSFGEDYTILSSYEINLSVGSTMIQPNGEVEIGIPIPKEYENASVSVIYMDSEHKITKLQTRRKDGMAYAKVNHFSNYALVGRAQEKEMTQSQNYLTALEAGAGIILSFGVGFWIWQKWKKFKKIAKDYPKE